LHQVRACSRADRPRRELWPCAEEHAGAGDDHRGAAARLDHRPRRDHRERVPVARHGPPVPQGGAERRHPDHVGLPAAGGLHLRDHQPDRRHPLRGGGSPHAHRRTGGRMSTASETPPEVLLRRPSRLKAMIDSDLVYSFLHSKVTIVAAIVTLVIVLRAMFGPDLAPKNPYDLTQISILDSNNPPIWMEGGQAPYVLGTDDQGRDVFSTILYGSAHTSAHTVDAD